MNILHISDLHLGKIVNGFSMIEDQQYILNQIVETITNNQIDVLVIAGDIYDRAIAPVEAIEVWSQFLEQIAKLNIETLIINGNHDSMKRLDFASGLLKSNHIHVVSTDCLYQKVSLENVDFYLLPFISLEQASNIINQRISDFTQLKQQIVKRMELDSNRTNILVDHSYIITGNHDIEQDSAIRPLALGGSEFTNGQVYADFDLVLAGHVHRHSHIKPNIYYSGSILPYSIGEQNNKQGYYIHQVEEQINSTYHHFKLLRPMRTVELYIEDINTHLYSEDYVVIKLLDDGQVINPLEKVRVKYPNVMQIDRKFRTIDITTKVGTKQATIEQSFVEFYNLNSEQEISTESLNYFNHIANKITKGDEDAST